MSIVKPARRAERFAALVDAGGTAGADARSVELLELVGALRSVPAPTPRPEFVADLRERLMLAAATELTAASLTERERAARLTVPPRPVRQGRRTRIALGTVALLGATASVAVASQHAIPGEGLYPLKRVIENTQAGIQTSDQGKGTTILASASDRLTELDELTSDTTPDADLVTSTLDTFSDQATEASQLLLDDFAASGNEASINELHNFAKSSMITLGEIAPSVPPAAHDSLVSAATLLYTIDYTAEQACPACQGQGITEVPAPLVAAVAAGLQNADGTVASSLGGRLPLSGVTGLLFDGSGQALAPPPSGVTSPPPVSPSATPNPSDSESGGAADGGRGDLVTPPVVPVLPENVLDTAQDVLSGVVDGVTDVVGGLTGSSDESTSADPSGGGSGSGSADPSGVGSTGPSDDTSGGGGSPDPTDGTGGSTDPSDGSGSADPTPDPQSDSPTGDFSTSGTTELAQDLAGLTNNLSSNLAGGLQP